MAFLNYPDIQKRRVVNYNEESEDEEVVKHAPKKRTCNLKCVDRRCQDETHRYC
jgi:hypothetical protein